jgi:hypothetical protein
LFNLSSSRQFTNTKEGAIYCRSGYGPWFGSYYCFELWADEPFNGDEKCGSRANKPGYEIVIEVGKNMLSNKEDGYFTISEIEVWEVVNVENLKLKGKKTSQFNILPLLD